MSDSIAWENFRKWWKAHELKEDLDYLKSSYHDHPLLTLAMAQSRSVTAVVDVKEMKFLYWSGNVKELVGWNDQNFVEGGVEFAYSKFHPDDLPGLSHFTELITDYYKNLSDAERAQHRNYRDHRFVKPNGEFIRLIQQGSVLKHDEDGNIAAQLILVSDATNYKNDKSMHLRLTNGKENRLYEYNLEEGKLITLECPSKRELEVFQYISKGDERTEIAERLGISFDTLKKHCQHVLQKLRVKSSLEAISLLKMLGFL